MVLAAVEIAPASDILSALESATAPTVVGEPAGTYQETRALSDVDDGVDVMEDSFTAGNGTAIASRTPSPTAGPDTWAADSGFTIQSNAANARSATLVQRALYDAGAADVRITTDITYSFGDAADAWQGIIVRGNGGTSGTFLVIRPNGWDGTRQFVIEDESGNRLARFPLSSVAADDAAIVSWEVDCSGDEIRLWLDGVAVGFYSLTADESATYGTATEFGMWSNEQDNASTGSWDDYLIRELAAADTSYLSATEAGIVRYFSFRPPVYDSALLEFVQLELRQARTGYGVWKPRLGVLNSQGDIVWGAAMPAPIQIAQDDTFVTRYSADLPRVLDSRNWDAFTPTLIFLKLESVTEDADQTYGTAKVSQARLRLRYNQAPTVTADSVDVTGSNPVLAWTFTDPDDDAQHSFDVRVWDPAVIAANPDTALEDLDAVYESGRVISNIDRTHRVDAALDGATLYTFGVRCYQARVGGRDIASEWDTIDATTPAATDTTPTAVAVAGTGQVVLTISDLGAALAANIERSVDGGDYETLRLEVPVTTARTAEAYDSFDRSNGALGNEESANTYAWSNDSGSGASTSAIVSNGAEIDGDGGAEIDPGQTDVAVSAVVDLTQAQAGVRLRSGATGYVEAVIDSNELKLQTFDSGGTPHGANTSTVSHDVSASTAALQLIASGDEYLVLVNGEVLIRNIDATVPSKAETAVGISSGGTAGTHRVDDFACDLLDAEIAFTDTTVPQGVTIDYNVTAVIRHAGLDTYSSAAAASNQVTVTDGVWRLRDPVLGTSLDFDPEDVRITQARPGTVVGGVPQFGSLQGRRFRLTLRTLNATDFDTLETLLAITGDLTLSDIYGSAWTVRNAADVEWDHVTSEPEPGESFSVRHHWLARIELQEVT